MDIAARLKEVRKASGLSQKQVGELSSVGEKTLSSFESNRRIGRMKIEQLFAILTVIGMTPIEFFAGVDHEPLSTAHADDSPSFLLFDRFMALPVETQTALIPAFHLLMDIVVSREVRRAAVDPLQPVRELRRRTG